MEEEFICWLQLLVDGWCGRERASLPAPLAHYPVGRSGRQMQFLEPDTRQAHKSKEIWHHWQCLLMEALHQLHNPVKEALRSIAGRSHQLICYLWPPGRGSRLWRKPSPALVIHVLFICLLAQLSQGSTSDAIVSISSHGSRKHRYGWPNTSLTQSWLPMGCTKGAVLVV